MSLGRVMAGALVSPLKRATPVPRIGKLKYVWSVCHFLVTEVGVERRYTRDLRDLESRRPWAVAFRAQRGRY